MSLTSGLRSPNCKVDQFLAMKETRPKVVTLALGNDQLDDVAGICLFVSLD